MKRALAAVALLLVFALSASAVELTGRDIVIPYAGRTPGNNGTMWQTDLILTNLTPNYSKLTLHLDFVSGTSSRRFDVEVPRYGTVVLPDFVAGELHLQSGLGMVRVTADRSDAILAARAWVYNVGGGAELGQNVQGLERSSLPQKMLVPSLPTMGGNRSNVGIANPNDAEALVTVAAYTEGGIRLNYANLRIAANSVYQADLLTLLGDQARTAGMTLDVTSNVPVYAYGAVVRNASGDPYFVIGVPKPARPAPITPACETPAPLHESDDNLPTYIVVFHQNLDAKALTERFAAKYGFTSLAIFEAALKAFVAELTPQQIAGLRCEPEVRYIEQDSYAEPIFP